MKKEDYFKKEIYIYWWNMGTKILDFHGTYKEWFLKNKIKIYNYKGFVYFVGSFGSMTFKIKFQSNDYEHAFKHIIKLCLMYLGDKAMLIDWCNREYKINWI